MIVEMKRNMVVNAYHGYFEVIAIRLLSQKAI